MSKYYGIQRSSEYLQHYGVKGMKWGIRKAVAHPVSYLKAKRKLSKLTSEQKQLKKNVRRSMAKNDKTYKRLQEAKDSDKNTFIKKRLKVAGRRIAYRHARRKLMNDISVYTESLNKYQRRKIKNRVIRI